ncbi:MAG: hypothetical protein AAFU71_12070 [Cyanobacteria bacterium J06632_22]
MLQLTPQVQVVRARAADSLVDTIGVNTHLHYTDTVYDRFDSLIKPRLTDLNIRHIRDGAYTYPGVNRDTFYYQRLRELADEGIEFNLITQTLDTGANNPTNYALLDEVYQWSDGAISAFEGVNEPDLQGINNWVGATRQGQRQLYETVNGNPLLRHIPVIGPSVVTPAGRDRLGNLTAYTDYGNIHNYWGGRPPETEGWGANGYGSLDWNLDQAQTVSGADPIISTETGWQDGAHPSQPPLDEKVVARYLPRLFLTHFNAGLDRTYLYELVDQGGEQFGLLNGDGSPKPAYRSLKNFIDLFDDPGAAFRPSPLSVGLSGQTDNVDYTLLQKRDGTFYLALWIGESTAPGETDIPDQRVTLTLPQSLQSAATVYTFLDNGGLSTRNLSIQNGQLGLTVKDNLRVLRLVPQSGPVPAPSPSPTPAPSAPPLPPPPSLPRALLEGTPGIDVLSGTPGADLGRGYGGNDQLAGHGGDDRLLGGAGNDQIFGNGGNDALFGQGGNDRLTGGPGNDELYGGPGQDWLLGTTSNTLGRGEQDLLIGGDGADRFVLANGSGIFYGDGLPGRLGTEDFALIRGLGSEDRIQLKQGAQYRLQPNYTVSSGETGYALWINRDERRGFTDELIGVIQTGLSLSLDSDVFVFI